MKNAKPKPPLPLHRVLEEEYATLNGQDSPGLDKTAKSEARLNSVLQAIHGANHSALCFSGGGIRSATFALGVLQGMARKGLLDKFSYLSTVSGGGYVGGWLSAWIHRHKDGLPGVMAALKETSKSKIEPEPEPIQHLRSYSNYLTPRLGIFSADTWTVAAIVVRNLILNWLVLIPMLIVLLLVPRLAVAVIRTVPSGGSPLAYAALAVLTFIVIILLIGNRRMKPWGLLLLILVYVALVISLWYTPLAASLLIGFAGGVTCITYVGLKRPSSTLDYNDQKGFLLWCLLPLLTSAVALTTFWAWFRDSGTAQKQLENLRLPVQMGFLSTYKLPHYSIPFIVFGLLMYLTGFMIYSARLGHFSFWKEGWRGRLEQAHKFSEFLAMTMIGIIGGVSLWLIATKVFDDPASLSGDIILHYATFASPLYIGFFLLTAIVFAGISSEFTGDDDREWWARFGAWILIAMVVWSVLGYLTLLGPNIFAWLGAKYIVPAGGIVGFLTTRLAHSSKTSPKADEEQRSGWRGMLRSYALPLGALLFIGVLIIVLTYAINYMLAILTFIFGAISFNGKIMGAAWLLAEESMPKGELSDLNHMNIIHTASFSLLITLVIVIGVLGYLLARSINTNKFSYHAMYRNRLIRAYLGASNKNRFPNPFTGFDPADNIPMHELRPEFFHPGSFKDIFKLVQRLRNNEDAMSDFLRKNFSPKTIKYLEESDEHHMPSPRLQRALVEDFNRLIRKPTTLYDDDSAFSTIPESKKWFETEGSKPSTRDSILLSNRRLIEWAFPEFIHACPQPPQKPLHVVNMTLNLVQGKNLAWQDRKAASFTVSPLHSGSCQIPDFEDEDQSRKVKVYGSYRRSREYGGKDTGGISLGTAVAISGAAVSPNMGYYSSALVTFLMTLFNVRLGWWLGNPGKAGRDYYYVANPKSSAYPIVAEALGLTDADNPYVYLSDGGHFENLGLYEMVLRRCHTIVVVDASDDSDFHFDGLGNAIRKIRVDFGVPIDFDPMKILSRSKSKDKAGSFCAIGKILYSHIDKVPKLDSAGATVKDEQGKVVEVPAPNGTLVYIKPVFYGDEPRDIYHYAQANKRFPHESTADQWFSEDQFESYRSLGLYMVGKIFGEEVTNMEGTGKKDTFTLNEFSVAAKNDAEGVKDAVPTADTKP